MVSRQSGITYAVVGTGALGGFYGARLQQAGAEVHFLLRSDYNWVKQHGLQVESPEGNFHLAAVHAYENVNQMPACDVVIVALKTTQNQQLPLLLPPLMKQASVVLVLQNGLGVEAAAADVVGGDRVLGGLCFLCANKVAPGRIQHLDYKKISIGEYAPGDEPKGITERMRAIATDFEAAGIPIELATDLVLARWKKLVWNIPYNGLSVVLNARTDEIMADPAALALVEDLMAEVVRGAAAVGRTISPEFVELMLEHTRKMMPYRTSMKVDFDEGRSLELEAMYHNPLCTAQAAGVQLPKIQMLHQQLQFLDRRILDDRKADAESFLG